MKIISKIFILPTHFFVYKYYSLNQNIRDYVVIFYKDVRSWICVRIFFLMWPEAVIVLEFRIVNLFMKNVPKIKKFCIFNEYFSWSHQIQDLFWNIFPEVDKLEISLWIFFPLKYIRIVFLTILIFLFNPYKNINCCIHKHFLVAQPLLIHEDVDSIVTLSNKVGYAILFKSEITPTIMTLKISSEKKWNYFFFPKNKNPFPTHLCDWTFPGHCAIFQDII